MPFPGGQAAERMKKQQINKVHQEENGGASMQKNLFDASPTLQ